MSRARPARLSVIVTDQDGRPLAARGLARWLAHAAPRGARGVVNVALVSDRTMRRLNREFRRVDGVTDVLSFAAEDTGLRPQASGLRADSARGQWVTARLGPRARGLRPDPAPNAKRRATLLGDLAIAAGVAKRQAHAMGHPPHIELRILALHGLLHLLGYDHEADQGQMRRVEERLRRRAGLPAGLVARATGNTTTR